MKLKQLIPTKKETEIHYNAFIGDDEYPTYIMCDVIAYGLYSDGNTYPMVTTEKGQLEPIYPNCVVSLYEEGVEK